MTLIASERECQCSYIPPVPSYKRVGTSETGPRQQGRELGIYGRPALLQPAPARGHAGPILVGDGRVAAGVPGHGRRRVQFPDEL